VLLGAGQKKNLNPQDRFKAQGPESARAGESCKEKGRIISPREEAAEDVTAGKGEKWLLY